MNSKAEILKIYKNLGETPLECLYRFRNLHPEYADTKMTYLGRLDPMAEGLLLVLAGNTRAKEEYLRLDKAYEFEVLWGFETDTYDVLGLITNIGKTPEKLENKMAGLLKKTSTQKTQSYPPFSSKVFKGNYLRAREVKVDELYVPERGIKIFSIDHIHTRFVSGREILRDVSERIALVKGNFRQKEIIKSWKKNLDLEKQFLISNFKTDVSGGTYIRGLAHNMGKIIGNSAIAYSIKRTRVGEYSL
jgi:tRNA pseudouridine55 synthase